MKKNYLLIVDLFLIDNKIFLSKGLISLMTKLTSISIKRGEYGLIKAIKKPVFSKLILVLLTGILSFSSYAQTYKAFSVRKKIDIRGKMIVAGNNIIGKDNLPFNDNTKANQDISMQYIDIDGDPSTFSSSSANLLVPKQADGSATTCYRVAYAALYWGAMLQSGSRTDINKVKLKLPGATTYNDITGEIVYDAVVSPINPDANKPYACYADVTTLLAGLKDLTGIYTVANVTASTGFNGSTGLSAGWTLFVVYEDPSLHMKSFNVFDGFSHVYSSHFEKIPVTGFITPPSGNIDLQFAYAALDGDKPQGATKLEFGTKQVVTPLRPANNFFISTIENTNGVSTPRNPFGSNTLGYDTGVLEVIGADPEYINNNQTSTDFTLQVAKGQADPVFVFFSAYAVDIIAPKIDLTKIVKNTSGVNVGGGNVNLGQSLTYEISYQSVGNDNVKNFTIKDVLPINITFNPATSIDYTNAGGATFQSYDPLTRTIIFKIPNTSVEVNDGIYTIRINIQIVPDCNSLTTACSNEIKNQAFATYQGVINTNVYQEEGSFASTECKLGSPKSTNFLVDITNCKFTQNVILCGSSVVLKASDGYSTYSWSRNPDGSSPIGTGQTFTATQVGVYYVHNTAPSTCKDIVEEITVRFFGVTNTNPVIPYAQSPYIGEVVICPDDGKQLPNLFLCGANDSRLIQTGISDAAAIEWYKLNEGSCVAVVNPDCANESPLCIWALVSTGPNFIANISGQFRLTVRYPGGCFSQFYFNVYQNLLNPTVTSKDILCTTSGQITVGGVPSGYEYSLNAAGPYQPSNVFPNASFPVINAGSYTAYIKQVGVDASPCIFSVPDILIKQRNFTVSTFLTQPLCNGDKGAVKLVANDALPQYYFSISQGTTLVNSVGPITANEYEFSNLNPGVYTVRVRTDDGCDYSNTVTIISPVLLTATAAVTKPLTCTDGEITVYPVGGTPPYIYYVNSTTDFQSTPQIVVTNPLPTGGIYNIVVEDSNNCRTTTSITVAAIPPPVYTMSQTDIKCYNDNTGVINFNVTNANGYTLGYSIDKGVTYLPTPTFSNLVAGTYNTIVRYALGTAVCYGTMQVIIITGPSSAVTASAGVSELAGCGPSGEGKIRITNPQGGIAPYEYSFDNQATWTTVNDAYKAPGTYTVYIRDANGCIFGMPNIIIDPKPVEPTIQVEDAVFNCDGTANSTVTVTNNGGSNYSYQYLLDGVLNTNVPSNVFTNVPSGTHTVSVSYSLLSVPTYSNLLKEDFGSGAPTTTSGIASAYCFNDQRVTSPYPCGTRSVEDNQYSVASFFWRGDDPTSNNTGAWYHFKDNTSNGTNANGRYLLVNIGSAAGSYGVLYSKPIVDIIPNQAIKVDLYLANLIRASRTGAKPDFIIELVNASGTVVASQATGIIENNEIWNQKSMSLNPGNNTKLTFKIRSGSILYTGNDALIDDIIVYQLPKSCITTKDFTIAVSTGKAFGASITGFTNVSCSGANDGTITIAAQNFDATQGFQYSTNNGTTWNTRLTSPYTITGLAAANYTILIRYNASATGTCVKTFSQTIIAPAPLKVAATVTTLATCSSGATITAAGSGGTLAYRYELRDAAGAVVIRPYQLNAQFTNLPVGNYTVFAKDANGCVSAVGAALNVIAPPTLTATLDPSSDICFDSVNQVSLVVNASGGTPPFTYSLNGAAAQNSNTFTNVGTGTHNIVVTDSNNCTATINNIVIAPQLIAVVNTTKALDCTSSPNAVITGTISGGTAPFTVTVLSGTGPGTIAQPTATTFTYTTAVASTYQFQILDAKGCITLITATVNPLVPITASVIKTDPTCNGNTDGSIKLRALTGEAPFTYSITGVGSLSSANVFGSLSAGSYNYIVRDNKGCDATGTITLNNPAPIAVTIGINGILCNNVTLGSFDVNVNSGGTAPYVYRLYNNSFTEVANYTELSSASSPIHNFGGLNFGDYYITVVDAKGCEFKSGKLRIEPTPYLYLTSAIASVSCATGVAVTLNVTGGNPNYTYSIFGQPVTSSGSTPATSYIFNGLDQNTTYVFEVIDVNGCPSYLEVTTPTISPIIISSIFPKNVTCNGADNGDVTFTVSNYDATVTQLYYEVRDNLTNVAIIPPKNGNTSSLTGAPFIGTITGLKPGNYTLYVKETDGTLCSAAAFFQITQPTQPLFSTIIDEVNANCNNPAQITLTTTGGIGPYTYAYAVNPAVPSSFSSNNVLSLDPGPSGTNLIWNIIVKDINGCTFPLTKTIVKDPSPEINLTVTDKCATEGAFEIVVSEFISGVGPYYISVNSPNAYQSMPGTYSGTPYTLTGLNSGNYDIYVKDKNGCISNKQVTIDPPLQLTYDISVLPTCNNADGEVTLTAAGGTIPASYQYSKDGSIYVPLNVFGGLAPNTYTFWVKDTVTLCTKSVIIVIENPNQTINFSLTPAPITCNGGNDGTITVNLNPSTSTVNNNPIYRYTLTGTVARPIQDSNIFSGLPSGNYTVTVTSGRGCVATQTITVTEPAIIAVPAPNVVQFGCNSGSNAMNFAIITVTGVTGGSGVYTNYEFIKGGTRVQFGTSNVYTEANLLGGTYTVNVYDNKGCIGTAPSTITILPFIALDDINIAVNNAITCINPEDIAVSVTSIGGTPTNLQYTVADSNTTTGVIGANYNFTNTTGVFTGLNIGNYIITVENLDTGCSIRSVHYVNNPNTFDLNIINSVDVTCFGGTNGSANVTIIDRTITASNPDQAGPFSYTIVDALGNPVSSGTSANSGPFTINALAAGMYSITATLTNNPFCGVTKNFTINQPSAALAISVKYTNITCVAGNNDGSISATATGGWPGGYQFQLERGATVVTAWSSATNFTGLTLGTYTVRVRDTKGCSVFVDVILVNPNPIMFTANPSTPLVSCFGDKNASITVSLPTGGQGSNYLYTLNTTSMVPAIANGPQASPIFIGLGAGTYTITVSDGWGCSATSSAPIVIAEPTVVTASLVVATAQTCINPATLTLSAVGGTPPYTYSPDGITYNATTFNPSVTFPVPVGTHNYYVKDANGCASFVSNDIQIDPLPALIINLDLSNAVVNCAGDDTGVIVATAQGGLGNYVYTLQDAAGNPLPAAVQASPGVFTQLIAGGYKVQVSSLDCSATSALINVTEPSTPLTATYVAKDATCNGANNGTIKINASGGTGIIKYAISPRLDQFFVSNIFELLRPGFYEIIAQDQNGCYVHTVGIEIEEPTLIIPSVDPSTIMPELCFGDKDGAFMIDIIGGTAPYSVSLDQINGPFTAGTATQAQFDFTGLAGGDHTVYIRDANLCNAEITVPLPESVKLNPKTIVDYGCLNNAPSLTVTVTIDASITNPADVDYALDGSGSYQTSKVFTNVTPGIHFITARHTNGCEKDTPDFEILQVDPLSLVLTDGGLNEIVATTTGGRPGYRYTLNGEDFRSQNTFIFYKSGDFTVTVTDSNGCVATATRYFEFVDIKIPNVFTPNGDGDNDGWTPTNTMNYPDLVFHIFDRYGRKVGTYRYGQFWDGKYNGLELPTGDYWYVLKLQNEKDSREFVGHFTLYR